MAHDRRDAREGASQRDGSGRQHRGRQADKSGLNTEAHLSVDVLGMPARFLVALGVSTDCRSAVELTNGFRTDCLLAERAYDTEAALVKAAVTGAEPVILQKSNRLVKREIDRHVYRQRNMVENALDRIKRWRSLATRYCKRLLSFVAAVQIRCRSLWPYIS